MLLGGAKIVAAGGPDAGGAGQFALARYDADGTLDSTCGSGGKVLTRFPASLGDAALAVSLQPDGKIVVAGGSGASESSSAFSLARYDSNGTLDASFGTGGTVTTDFGARRRAHPCDLAEAVGGRRRHTGPGRADAADDVLIAREARGEAEDQDGGQGGEGADARMREPAAGASRKTKACRNFFLTGLGLRIYLTREVLRA
jgi:uncharacterized delta-60 repeat protein